MGITLDYSRPTWEEAARRHLLAGTTLEAVPQGCLHRIATIVGDHHFSCYVHEWRGGWTVTPVRAGRSVSPRTSPRDASGSA